MVPVLRGECARKPARTRPAFHRAARATPLSKTSSPPATLPFAQHREAATVHLNMHRGLGRPAAPRGNMTW
jgi:hypothetical protein